MRIWTKAAVSVGLVLAISACGGGGGGAGGASEVCTPGATRACTGPGACQGGQACASDGSAWGPCDCGTGGSSSTTGTSSSGTGGATTTTSASSGTGGSTSSTSSTASSGSGGGTSSSSTSSTSSSSGSCVPKTCLTLGVELAQANGQDPATAKACGLLFDGCANYLDCGGCNDPIQGCGEAKPGANPVSGLCGGGCVKAMQNPVQFQFECTSLYPQDTSWWVCSKQTSMPPTGPNGLPSGCALPYQATISTSWCCP